MDTEAVDDTEVPQCDVMRPPNESEAIDHILDDFKTTCESYDKHHRKRCKHRYYGLGIMAKVVTTTTAAEMEALLSQGARTFLIDTVTEKPSDIDAMLTLVKETTAAFESSSPKGLALTGLALEIQGDSCRLGRLRNNESLYLQADSCITLTMEQAYRYSGYKSICHVMNLQYYVKTLRLNDVIRLGTGGCRGRVVKIMPDKVALLLEEGGPVSSYDLLTLPNQCYLLKPEDLTNIFTGDLQTAAEVGANFIVMRKLRCRPFLAAMNKHIREAYSFKVIGSVDYDFMREKLVDLRGVIEQLDFLWIPDMFTVDECTQNYVYAEVIPLAKCLRKPIIGTVPIEKCSDFKRFENHEFLWKIDAYFVEKSPWCGKYPLIVKRLLPLADLQRGALENHMHIREYASNLQAVVGFVQRTISTIECQAIILHARSEAAADYLACAEIYCPVIVIVTMENESETARIMDLVRLMNLRRNLRAFLYDDTDNECDLQPINFAIRHYRKSGLLETGDFVVTLETCQTSGEKVEFGVGDDGLLCRAFYLRPVPICEMYMYA